MGGLPAMTRRQCLAGGLSAAALAPSATGRAFGATAIPGRELTEGRASRIDALLRQLTDIGMFNGVLKIDQGGETVFDRAYGLADYERQLPFGPETVFRIASLSKNMTSAALAAMAAQGELGLDGTIEAYLPRFPGSDRITIRMIAEHRSGIAHTNDQPWGDGSTALSPEEVLDRLSRLPLAFEPGARRSYSNGGYAVLARIMEMVRGQPYERIMRDLVFAPAGMTRSGEIHDSNEAPPGWAKGYQPGLSIGSRHPARFHAAETRRGGGSLYASAADVLRFFQAAWRGRLPGAAAYPSLFGGSNPRLGADGRAPGFYMDVYYVREADLIVSSTANNYAAEFRWAENIARLALGEVPLFGRLPALGSASAAIDPRWLGRFRYENSNLSQELEIRELNRGEIVLTDRAAGDSRALLPMADGGFVDPLYYWACRLDPADGGRILCSPFYEGGFELAMIRLS